MKVRIASGRVKLTVDLPAHPPATVGDALRRLVASHPEPLAAWTDASGRLRESLQIFVNGESVRYRGGLACPLAEGDEIYVIPLIAGG
jgi:molybdopterin converting factor small subunit